MVGVVLIEPKYPHNVGNAARAASCFGAERVAWTGRRFDIGQLSRLPREERMKGYRSVHMPSHHCLNLATAVSVVLYDRRMKRQLAGQEPGPRGRPPLSEMLREHRGFLDLEEFVARP